MGGHRRWFVLIGLSLLAIGALGLVGTQLQLSRAKEHPCGTPLRIDLRESTQLVERATYLRAGGDDIDDTYSPEGAESRARTLDALAVEAATRCQDRQRLALLGLGAGGAVAGAAFALSTYQLGRRRGRMEDRAESRPT